MKIGVDWNSVASVGGTLRGEGKKFINKMLKYLLSAESRSECPWLLKFQRMKLNIIKELFDIITWGLSMRFNEIFWYSRLSS